MQALPVAKKALPVAKRVRCELYARLSEPRTIRTLWQSEEWQPPTKQQYPFVSGVRQRTDYGRRRCAK